MLHHATRLVVNRRQFLEHAALGAVVVAAPRSVRWPHAPRDTAGHGQRSAPLQQLLAGNERFVAGRLTSPHLNAAALRAATVEKQTPFAAVLGCADSRVPVELVFDQSIGNLFVTRVAGNIVTSEIIASLEYAVAVLGVRAILVLAHSNCGAVKAAMHADRVPGQISALYPHIRPAVEASGGNLERAVDANAKRQADLLRTSSTVIRDATANHTITVAAAVYNLSTGKVTPC